MLEGSDDAASRLSSLTQDLASTASDQTLSFTHNSAFQAITRTGTNASYVWTQPSPSTANSTANGRNQIATLNGANFTYDGRGNLTSTGAASYGYDVYNRLTSAGSATLAYDPVGRLYQTVGGGVTTRFLYDGAAAIAEYNASNVLQRRFVHGPGVDEPIVWYEGAGTSDRRWLHQDRLGSVIAISNGAGAATNINTYDEYGVPGSSNAGRFQYTGQMWIPEAALYHYKARAYAPSLGRFLQTDPILYAGGMNLYAYVANDPVNWTDPWGLFGAPEPDGGGAMQRSAPWGLDIVCDPTGLDCWETEPIEITLTFCDISPEVCAYIRDYQRGAALGSGSGDAGGGSNSAEQAEPHFCPAGPLVDQARAQVRFGTSTAAIGFAGTLLGRAAQADPKTRVPGIAMERAGSALTAIGTAYVMSGGSYLASQGMYGTIVGSAVGGAVGANTTIPFPFNDILGQLAESAFDSSGIADGLNTCIPSE